jgi:hypothetical protein
MQGVGAQDQVEGPVDIGVHLAQVAVLVGDVGQGSAGAGKREHRHRDIHRYHVAVAGGEQGGVLSGATAQIDRPLPLGEHCL